MAVVVVVGGGGGGGGLVAVVIGKRESPTHSNIQPRLQTKKIEQIRKTCVHGKSQSLPESVSN